MMNRPTQAELRRNAYPEIAEQWDKEQIEKERQRKYDALPTSSHSERDIYDMCVRLMRKVYNDMLECMGFMDFDYDEEDSEEIPVLMYNPQKIVQMLFLQRTSHSGGASTLKKCDELGIDTDSDIVFETEREED